MIRREVTKESRMNASRSLQVGVIGGGLGGLAAACTLAARGHRVTLLERNGWLGGKAARLEAEGFTFDMGPTILTLPSVLERVFAEAGEAMSDHLELVPLNPQWRCFFQDGTSLDLNADTKAMVATLRSYAGESVADGYQSFMSWAAELDDISSKFFFWKSIGSMRDMFQARSSFSPAMLSQVLKMKIGQTVASSIHAKVPDGRVAQMLEHFTQYVGSAPDASPAVLCGIANMQTNEGIWYPRGGTGAVPAALGKLAERLGVQLITGTGVQQITHERGRFTGVVLDTGERLTFDAVVSNSDAVRTHRELLDGPVQRRFNRRRKYEPACSGVVLYLGLKERYEHLLHHNFVFSRDASEEFETIYRQGEPAPDPTAYVCAPARTEPEVAPHGGEALYVLVHTPYLRPHHDWAEMLPKYRQVIFDKLASTAGMTDLEDRIVFEQALTPHDIHTRYHVLNGAIYGLASHGRFFGAFKPANRSADLKGLYLAGGAAHPGPGMPMVLMSGWIAGDSLDQDVASGRLESATMEPAAEDAVHREHSVAHS